MNFNSKYRFDSIFLAPFSVVANNARTEVELKIPSFSPSDYINTPTGASHFKLVCAVTVLSDYVFDNDYGKYIPVNPSVNCANKGIGSNAIDIKPNIVSDIFVKCTIPDVFAISASSTLVCSVGIQFMQMVDGNLYDLKGVSAMKITSVF